MFRGDAVEASSVLDTVSSTRVNLSCRSRVSIPILLRRKRCAREQILRRCCRADRKFCHASDIVLRTSVLGMGCQSLGRIL